MNELVDHQKTAGADHLSGLAHAAQSAASDLQQRSPAAAQLVRDAATTVDRFAGDLRSSDIRDIVASVTTLARQQPVAFFAGSVLLGLAFARFFKSEMPAGVAPRRAATDGVSGYQNWSAAHNEGGNL